MALKLFNYDAKSNNPVNVIDTFDGYRKSIAAVPDNMEMRFSISQIDKKNSYFDSEKIGFLFNQADFVVSHNDADIERKLIATLVPEVAIKPWYSSQKDIPWVALGFKSNRLTQIAVALKIKAPKVAMERVQAIQQILLKTEVDTSQLYLERLYNMQPMKDFKWTMSVTKQYKKLKNAKLVKILKMSAVFIALSLFAIAAYVYFF